jgi:hypothetical protein
VVGHVEEENLRRADQERGLDPRRLRRRAALEQETDQMTQRAEPAQHGRDQRTNEGAVALRHAGKIGVCAGALELVVEGAAAAQHGIEDVGRDAPGGEARRGVVAARSSR